MKIKYVPSIDPRIAAYNEFISTNFPHFITETSPELLLVAGGDGALHHAIYQNSTFEGIFFGKALGTLNFLMNIFSDDLSQLRAIESDTLKPFVSYTDTISVYKNNEYLGEAANDIIFGDSVNGYHEYSITTEDLSFRRFFVKGTGLCLSTPLGSTAYNLNNGGPILPLESKTWSITGIACNRFIKDILPSQVITIQANSGRIFLSGIDKGELARGDVVELRPGRCVRIGFLDESSFTQRRVAFAHRYRKEE